MFGTLTLSANGIVLENSKKLTMTNNIISTSNNYGIFANNARESIIDEAEFYLWRIFVSCHLYRSCDKWQLANMHHIGLPSIMDSRTLLAVNTVLFEWKLPSMLGYFQVQLFADNVVAKHFRYIYINT